MSVTPLDPSSSLLAKEVLSDVVAAACHNGHYSTIWRVSLGVGVVFPMALLLLRIRLKEPEGFTKNSMKRKTPYALVLKYYWWRLLCVSIIWFLYDVSRPSLLTLTRLELTVI